MILSRLLSSAQLHGRRTSKVLLSSWNRYYSVIGTTASQVQQEQLSTTTALVGQQFSSFNNPNRFYSTTNIDLEKKKYTMETLKQLRTRSGAPIVDCKKALEACETLDDAMDWLREHGSAKTSQKVSGRETNEGLIGMMINNDQNKASLIKIASETDFASRSDTFNELVTCVANSVLQYKTSGPGPIPEADVLQTSVDTNNTTVDGLLKEAIVSIRENLSIPTAIQMDVESNIAEGNNNVLVGYIHGKTSDHAGTSAAVVHLSYDSNSNDENSVHEIGKKLAMHIVAARPQYLSTANVPEEVIEKEKLVLQRQFEQQEQELEEKVANDKKKKYKKKSPEIVEKIITGKLRKFYESVCLIEQDHMIEEDNPKIKKLLQNKGVAVQQFQALWI